MTSKKPPKGTHGKLYVAVREHALGFPEAYEEFPWGHAAIKVRKRIFVTLGEADGTFRMSLKLVASNFDALLLPFTEPTHYGMGKHGWVTASFTAEDPVPLDLIRDWIDESYRAVAPKSVLAKMEVAETGPETAKARPAKKRKR